MNMSQSDVSQDTTEEIKDEEKERQCEARVIKVSTVKQFRWFGLLSLFIENSKIG